MWRYARLGVLIVVTGVITTTAIEFNELYATSPQLAGAAASGEFGDTLAWVIAGGYLLMYLGMVAEGPIVTAAASFAAALGYFDVGIVFLLAILGDLTGDAAYYAIGYIGRRTVIDRFGHRLGLSRARMERIERLIKTHPWKAMVAIKFTFATPGLIMVGVTRMDIRKYTMYCVAIILPRVLLFTVLGYYFGNAYASISQYIENAQYFLVMTIMVVLVIYYGYTKLSIALSRRLQPI